MSPELELHTNRRSVPEWRQVLSESNAHKSRALGHGLRGEILRMSPKPEALNAMLVVSPPDDRRDSLGHQPTTACGQCEPVADSSALP